MFFWGSVAQPMIFLRKKCISGYHRMWKYLPNLRDSFFSIIRKKQKLFSCNLLTVIFLDIRVFCTVTCQVLLRCKISHNAILYIIQVLACCFLIFFSCKYPLKDSYWFPVIKFYVRSKFCSLQNKHKLATYVKTCNSNLCYSSIKPNFTYFTNRTVY